MPVEVHLEPDRFKSCEAEDCADCKMPTRYWLDPHTPLCPSCAVKRPGPVICPGCNKEIDPEVCWCGDPMNRHVNPMEDGHSPVPMGCDCGRIPSDWHDKWKQKSFDILIKHIASIIPPDAAIKQLSGIPLVEALREYVFVHRSDRDRLLAVIKAANGICRSMHSIVERRGSQTNWDAFSGQLLKQLAVQHQLLFGHKLADIPAASSKLEDGWWIPHPGTLQWQKCESFEKAMDEWFEGFNLPRLVENGHMDDIETASDRVRRFFDGSQNITNDRVESVIRQLERAVKASSMNRMDLAIELGVQPSLISKWLSQDSNPTLNSLEKLARILGKKLVLVDV